MSNITICVLDAVWLNLKGTVHAKIKIRHHVCLFCCHQHEHLIWSVWKHVCVVLRKRIGFRLRTVCVYHKISHRPNSSCVFWVYLSRLSITHPSRGRAFKYRKQMNLQTSVCCLKKGSPDDAAIQSMV